MLTSTLIQEIINKYNAIETNILDMTGEDRIVPKIKERISKNKTVLYSPQMTGKKLEKIEKKTRNNNGNPEQNRIEKKNISRC